MKSNTDDLRSLSRMIEESRMIENPSGSPRLPKFASARPVFKDHAVNSPSDKSDKTNQKIQRNRERFGTKSGVCRPGPRSTRFVAPGQIIRAARTSNLPQQLKSQFIN
jgi:hypothetical protein